MHTRILILDFGSQVTQLIARRVRDAGVYSEVHPCDVSDEFVRNFGAKGIILGGSHMSAYEEATDRAPGARCRRVFGSSPLRRVRRFRTWFWRQGLLALVESKGPSRPTSFLRELLKEAKG